jgi:hypothetical protein
MDMYSKLTSRALAVISRGVLKSVKGEKWSSNEARIIGYALGWLVVTTTNTENDFTKDILMAIDEIKTYNAKTRVAPSSIGGPMPSMVAATAGKRRKGGDGDGPGLKKSVIGLVVAGLLGSGILDLRTKTAINEETHQSSSDFINAACSGVPLYPPPKTWMGVLGGNAQALASWEAATSRCNTAKSTGLKQIQTASKNWEQAVASIPKLAGNAVTLSGIGSGQDIKKAMEFGTSVSTVFQMATNGKLPENEAGWKPVADVFAEGAKNAALQEGEGGFFATLANWLYSPGDDGDFGEEPDEGPSVPRAPAAAAPAGQAWEGSLSESGIGGRRRSKTKKRSFNRRTTRRRRSSRYLSAPVFSY